MYRFYTAITETPCVTLEKGRGVPVQYPVDRVLETLRAGEHPCACLSSPTPATPPRWALEREEVRRILQRHRRAGRAWTRRIWIFGISPCSVKLDEHDNLIILRDLCPRCWEWRRCVLGFAVANPTPNGSAAGGQVPL